MVLRNLLHIGGGLELNTYDRTSDVGTTVGPNPRMIPTTSASYLKSPAIKCRFELIPIKSMLDHLYNRDRAFRPVKSVFAAAGIAGRGGNLVIALSTAFYTNSE